MSGDSSLGDFKNGIFSPKDYVNNSHLMDKLNSDDEQQEMISNNSNEKIDIVMADTSANYEDSSIQMDNINVAEDISKSKLEELEDVILTLDKLHDESEPPGSPSIKDAEIMNFSLENEDIEMFKDELNDVCFDDHVLMDDKLNESSETDDYPECDRMIDSAYSQLSNSIDDDNDDGGIMDNAEENLDRRMPDWTSAKVLMLREISSIKYKYDEEELGLPNITYMDTIESFRATWPQLLKSVCEDDDECKILEKFDILIISPFFSFFDDFLSPLKVSDRVKPKKKINSGEQRRKLFNKLRLCIDSFLLGEEKLKKEYPHLKVIWMLPHPIRYEETFFDDEKQSKDEEKYKTFVSINQYCWTLTLMRLWFAKMIKSAVVSLTDFVVSPANHESFVNHKGLLRWKEEIKGDCVGLGFSRELEGKIWDEIRRLSELSDLSLRSENEQRYKKFISEAFYGLADELNFQRNCSEVSKFLGQMRKEISEIGIHIGHYDTHPQIYRFLHERRIKRLESKAEYYRTQISPCLPPPGDQFLPATDVLILGGGFLKNYMYDNDMFGLPNTTYLDAISKVTYAPKWSILVQPVLEKSKKMMLENFDILIISPFNELVNNFLNLSSMYNDEIGKMSEITREESHWKTQRRIMNNLENAITSYYLGEEKLKKKYPNLKTIWILPHPIKYDAFFSDIVGKKLKDIERYKAFVSINQYCWLLSLMQRWFVRMIKSPVILLTDFVISPENHESFLNGEGLLQWKEEIEGERVGCGFPRDVEENILNEIIRLSLLNTSSIKIENEKRYNKLMSEVFYGLFENIELKIASDDVLEFVSKMRKDLEEIGLCETNYDYHPQIYRFLFKRKNDEKFSVGATEDCEKDAEDQLELQPLPKPSSVTKGNKLKRSNVHSRVEGGPAKRFRTDSTSDDNKNSKRSKIDDKSVTVNWISFPLLPLVRPMPEWSSARVLMCRQAFMEDKKYVGLEFELPNITYVDTCPDFLVSMKEIFRYSQKYDIKNHVNPKIFQNFDLLLLSPFNCIVHDRILGPAAMKRNYQHPMYKRIKDLVHLIHRIMDGISRWHKFTKERFPSLKIVWLLPHPISYGERSLREGNYSDEFLSLVSTNQYSVMSGICKKWVEDPKMKNIPFSTSMNHLLIHESFMNCEGSLKWRECPDDDRIGFGYSKQLEEKMWQDIKRLWAMDERSIIDRNEKILKNHMKQTPKNEIPGVNYESFFENRRKVLERVGVRAELYDATMEYYYHKRNLLLNNKNSAPESAPLTAQKERHTKYSAPESAPLTAQKEMKTLENRPTIRAHPDRARSMRRRKSEKKRNGMGDYGSSLRPEERTNYGMFAQNQTPARIISLVNLVQAPFEHNQRPLPNRFNNGGNMTNIPQPLMNQSNFEGLNRGPGPVQNANYSYRGPAQIIANQGTNFQGSSRGVAGFRQGSDPNNGNFSVFNQMSFADRNTYVGANCGPASQLSNFSGFNQNSASKGVPDPHTNSPIHALNLMCEARKHIGYLANSLMSLRDEMHGMQARGQNMMNVFQDPDSQSIIHLAFLKFKDVDISRLSEIDKLLLGTALRFAQRLLTAFKNL